jgi:hypothetical protein
MVEQITPQKQLLVFLCYLSNQESMREIGHYFGLGKSTVHGILRRVSTTLNYVLGHVCYDFYLLNISFKLQISGLEKGA